MHVIAITRARSGEGEVPNGVVLYHRPHFMHPYVVHNYAFRDEGVSLFQGDYSKTLEYALELYRRRTQGIAGREDAVGDAFDEALAKFNTERATRGLL